MADYRRYKTETLERMYSKALAESVSAAEAVDRNSGWGDGFRKVHLMPGLRRWEKASERVKAIREELNRRKK